MYCVWYGPQTTLYGMVPMPHTVWYGPQTTYCMVWSPCHILYGMFPRSWYTYIYVSQATHTFWSDIFSSLRPESERERVREMGADCGPRLLTVTHMGFWSFTNVRMRPFCTNRAARTQRIQNVTPRSPPTGASLHMKISLTIYIHA